MTIGINGNEANVVHRVGVGQYAFELLSQFSKLKVQSQKLKVYLSSPPVENMPELNYEVFGPKKLWTLTGLQRKLLLNPPDILFTPTHYAPLYVPCPSVISIMDLAFEKFPQYFKPRDLYQLKYWTRYSAKQAKKILTISENTKKDIVDLYKISADKIVVTYPGYDDERFTPKIKNQKSKIKNTMQKFKIDGSYFLFLGTLQPRKNLERLIEAFRLLRTNNYKLVIAGMINEGRGGWMNEKIKAEKNIILTGYVPDQEVPILMANAKAFVLPSLYEGFGIPAIEAMACGTPVIVSRVSSLPEVCGNAVSYIKDPYSVSSIQQALQDQVLQTASERAKMVSLGLDWVKRYNWETTAKQTLEVLYEAIQG